MLRIREKLEIASQQRLMYEEYRAKLIPTLIIIMKWNSKNLEQAVYSVVQVRTSGNLVLPAAQQSGQVWQSTVILLNYLDNSHILLYPSLVAAKSLLPLEINIYRTSFTPVPWPAKSPGCSESLYFFPFRCRWTCTIEKVVAKMKCWFEKSWEVSRSSQLEFFFRNPIASQSFAPQLLVKLDCVFSTSAYQQTKKTL